MAGRMFEKREGLHNIIPKKTGWLSSCGDSGCAMSPKAEVPRSGQRERGCAGLFTARVLLDRESQHQKGKGVWRTNSKTATNLRGH